jgi:hypothetical protein
MLRVRSPSPAPFFNSRALFTNVNASARMCRGRSLAKGIPHKFSTTKGHSFCERPIRVSAFLDRIPASHQRSIELSNSSGRWNISSIARYRKVRLRNISGKPINGLRSYLYFKPPGSTVLFRVALVPSRDLQLQNVDAAAEIDLTVTNQQWNQTAEILKQHGADPKLSAVTFSVELVSFSDGLQWYRGRLLRRDPEDPSKWIPVEKPGL